MRDFVLKMMTDYRHRSKKNEIKFDLNYSEFRALVTSPCFYCGGDPENRTLTCVKRGKQDRMSYTANGIDRIDAHFGYTLANCVTCCQTCNTMKAALTHDEFLAHVQKILTNFVR